MKQKEILLFFYSNDQTTLHVWMLKTRNKQHAFAFMHKLNKAIGH